ncbi:ribonuclease H-like domain-containing protein [Tanacetum coccineum]
MSPKAVLLKTSLTPVNIVRHVNTAHPKTTVYSAKPKTYFSKQAQSTAKRPFYKQKALTRRSVHEAKRHYYTGRHYAVNTARSYSGQVNVVRVKGVNAVKSLAYWVWRPTKSNGASLAFKRHNYIDARGRSNGCSRHMTGNIAYLSDFKQFDGGSAYGGKITEKGIKRECSVARTPQQNGVAERRNRTLIKAALKQFTADTSYFDSPTKDVDNGEPKTSDDAQKQVKDGLNNENAKQERFVDDSNTKDVNAVEQQVNTASPDVYTGSLKLNVAGPSVQY